MTAMSDIFKPKFLINPAVAAPMWRPKQWQMRRFVNPHYGNSLWLGVYSLLALPARMLGMLKGFAEGHFWMTIYMVLIGMPLIALRFAWWGLTGRARAINLPLEVLLHSQTMNEQTAYDFLMAGRVELVNNIRG